MWLEILVLQTPKIWKNVDPRLMKYASKNQSISHTHPHIEINVTVFWYMATPHCLEQGFSIILSCRPQRAEDSPKIGVWGPNERHCPMCFYVYWSWQRTKQVWSVGRIWPTGCQLRRPGLEWCSELGAFPSCTSMYLSPLDAPQTS